MSATHGQRHTQASEHTHQHKGYKVHVLLDVGCMCLCAFVSAGEIGDTWVFGVQSDPLKTANFRAVSRLRAACINTPTCTSGVSGVQLPAVLHGNDWQEATWTWKQQSAPASM
jgi:hypothetical protein